MAEHSLHPGSHSLPGLRPRAGPSLPLLLFTQASALCPSQATDGGLRLAGGQLYAGRVVTHQIVPTPLTPPASPGTVLEVSPGGPENKGSG